MWMNGANSMTVVLLKVDPSVVLWPMHSLKCIPSCSALVVLKTTTKTKDASVTTNSIT